MRLKQVEAKFFSFLVLLDLLLAQLVVGELLAARHMSHCSSPITLHVHGGSTAAHAERLPVACHTLERGSI